MPRFFKSLFHVPNNLFRVPTDEEMLASLGIHIPTPEECERQHAEEDERSKRRALRDKARQIRHDLEMADIEKATRKEYERRKSTSAG